MLSAASSHIKSLLGETGESVSVEFPNCSREILEALVTFVYTGKVVVLKDRVGDLMEVSEQLCIAELSSICQASLLGMLPASEHLEPSTLEKCIQTEVVEADSTPATLTGADPGSYSVVNSPCQADSGVPSPGVPCGCSKQLKVKEEAVFVVEKVDTVSDESGRQVVYTLPGTVKAAGQSKTGRLGSHYHSLFAQV